MASQQEADRLTDVLFLYLLSTKRAPFEGLGNFME